MSFGVRQVLYLSCPAFKIGIMYELIVYDGKYSSDGRFLNILFGHKHKKAIRIIIDFKEKKVVEITLYQKQAGLDILDKVLLRWNFTLSNKVKDTYLLSKKSLAKD